MLVLSATNPPGSREVGGWSIRTEVPVDGTWYTVDYNESPTSFFAKPGNINSKLEISNKMTYSADTTYSFNSVTEHDIPLGGRLLLDFPPEVAITEQVSSADLTIAEIVNNQIAFAMPTGYAKDTPLLFSVSGIRNPRSFKPTEAVVISSVDSEGFTID